MEKKWFYELLALACQVQLIDNIILPWDHFLMEFTLFSRKICFTAIYAVLSRNLFCRSLRIFCVETMYDQNVVRGEKMTNIMYGKTHSGLFKASGESFLQKQNKNISGHRHVTTTIMSMMKKWGDGQI